MAITIDDALHAPTKIPKKIVDAKEDAAPPPQVAGVVGMAMGMAGGSPGGVAGGVFPAAQVPAPRSSSRLLPHRSPPARLAYLGRRDRRVASLKRRTPLYPPIAKAAHVQGAVVLHAIIGKNGSIQNLTYVSAARKC